MRHVISLADPVGKIIDGGTLDSGLKIERVRTPLGVIGTITKRVRMSLLMWQAFA